MHATTLHQAIETDDAKACEALLEAGADVNAVDEVAGWTPLQWAVVKRSEACVPLLLKAGSDVNTLDEWALWTPMHWAANNGSVASLSLLMEAGADVDVDSTNGGTPLRIAITKRKPAVVALLAAAVPRLQVRVPRLQVHELGETMQRLLAWEGGGARSHPNSFAAGLEERRLAIVDVLQHESRWRRRRPLALIREQRRAVRDAGLVHKEWEREQEEAAARRKKKQKKR